LGQTALAQVNPQWLAQIPGQLINGDHLWVVAEATDYRLECLKDILDESQMMGASVAEGTAKVYADYLIKSDGFSRWVVVCDRITPRRLGRTVNRLLEMEAYRMAAMMALPVARQGAFALARSERELAELALAIENIQPEDELALLTRLGRLAGEVESLYAQSHSRLTAASAYFELVDRRIAELREQRLPGLQSFKEFTERRLSPARATCAWAMRRQESLSLRLARVSDLLRTRVEIEQQQSNQALLASMNQRQDLQLQMQATVEGLSVAAISYYIIGLISYLAKGAQKFGWPVNADLTAAIALPFVVFAVWWSVRQLHRRLTHRE
jgi:uncharacterized membrane-anchored protein